MKATLNKAIALLVFLAGSYEALSNLEGSVFVLPVGSSKTKIEVRFTSASNGSVSGQESGVNQTQKKTTTTPSNDTVALPVRIVPVPDQNSPIGSGQILPVSHQPVSINPPIQEPTASSNVPLVPREISHPERWCNKLLGALGLHR